MQDSLYKALLQVFVLLTKRGNLVVDRYYIAWRCYCTGGNSKALIVVDGIVRNSIGDINPSDIESIQVLKMPLQQLFMVHVPMVVLFLVGD